LRLDGQHVGAEHWHALIGEAFGQALQSDGLARSGGAGDEPVAVGEAEIDELGLDALADIDAVEGRRLLGGLIGVFV
jgi:hypothetical protein